MTRGRGTILGGGREPAGIMYADLLSLEGGQSVVPETEYLLLEIISGTEHLERR